MNFTKLKDRVWKTVDWTARAGISLPGPLARASFGGFGAILWIAYALPFVPARRSFIALSKQFKSRSATRLFHAYVRNFTLMLFRVEQIRQGQNEAIGALLHIPERARFDHIISRGGAIFVMPHAHGSVTMAEALGQVHPLLLFVRATKDDERAAWQRQYYDQMTCDVIDVRRADDVVASRTMLSALRNGSIILGGGDFIKAAPEMQDNPAEDVVRATAFGQPVGAMRWPARFASKVGVPIVPVTIQQTKTQLILHMGEEIEATDIVSTTQTWMDGMVDLIKAYPTDWVFCLDRQWRRVLENAAPGVSSGPDEQMSLDTAADLKKVAGAE
ncbi:MAG: hypothetical protein AAFZ10_11725 [Pseudomonadota bacterium]